MPPLVTGDVRARVHIAGGNATEADLRHMSRGAISTACYASFIGRQQRAHRRTCECRPNPRRLTADAGRCEHGVGSSGPGSEDGVEAVAIIAGAPLIGPGEP